jgi:hypothetical protein
MVVVGGGGIGEDGSLIHPERSLRQYCRRTADRRLTPQLSMGMICDGSSKGHAESPSLTGGCSLFSCKIILTPAGCSSICTQSLLYKSLGQAGTLVDP